MEIKVTINAPELAKAIESLALAVGCASDKLGAAGLPLAPVITEIIEDNNKTAEEPIDTTAAAIGPNPEPVKTYTIEEVRKAFVDFAKSNGKAAAKEILTKLNVTKVTELSDEQYGQALDMIKEAK